MEEILQKNKERFILVAVALQNMEEETMDSLEELEELVRTADGEVLLKVIQNRDSIHTATYIGKGKVEELKEDIINLGATGVICDDELSPMQLRNLEDDLHVKVLDRTALILDIFAMRANTSEGILQVELAQLKYNLSRLTGRGTSMSRLGGGIGTRGPGESKLETDRRHIRERITHLKAELREVQKNRDLLRDGRKKQWKPLIGIVGYTNAGKSTLLNALTGADVLEEDKLFATLDPTTRKLSLPEGKEVMVTDTVGFIRKLPHHLVEAFKSTLEEAAFADLLIHVVDCSNPDASRQIEIVYETLLSLKAYDKPVLTVFNKMDKENADVCLKDPKAFKCLYISAALIQGLDSLK